MKTNLFFAIVIGLCCLYQTAFATPPNNGSITGRVFIEQNQPAVFATVYVMQADTNVLVKAGATDEDGFFDIPSLQLGKYVVNISYVGYEDFQTEVIELSEGNFELKRIELQTIHEQLQEVVVKAKKPLVEVKPDKTILNVAGSINAQGEDALSLLRKAPGVILDNNENILLQGKTGTKVYIDGKPSPLSAEDLANYLKGISASTVEAVEVITNPSSKYEAEGNAGIINIRLIKNKNLGTHFNLTSGYSVGEHASYDAGIQFNNRNKYSNIFGGYSHRNHEGGNFMQFRRTIDQAFFRQDADITRKNQSHNIKTGIDWYLNDRSTAGVLVNAFLSDESNRNSSTTQIHPIKTLPYTQVLEAINDIDSERDNYNFNLNYAYNSKSGFTLNADADYGFYDNRSTSYQPNTYFEAGSLDILDKATSATNSLTDIKIYTFKLDAEKSIGAGTLGFGGKFAYVKTDNDYDFFNVINSNEREIDPERTNRFYYDENVNAAYVNYKKDSEKFSWQVGVRLEHTDTKGELVSLVSQNDQLNKNDYVDLFPSAGISWNLNQKNTFRLNYSRRLDRPNYQDLNPFEFKLDELTSFRGNPFLKPQYTNNIQLSHTYNYTLNTSLSYSHTKDMHTRLTDTSSLSTAFLTWENLASQDALSLNVSYPFSPAKWWSVFANVSANYLKNKSKSDDDRFTDDKSIYLEVQFLSFYSQNSFSLPKGYKLEISGYYNSPGIWGGNFETEEYWNVDAGIQKKFLDNKLSIKIGVSDIFLGQRWEAINQFGVLSIHGNGGYDSRRFKVNLTYSFGNDQIKRSRKRSTGMEEEQKRARSGGGSGPG
jgi:outer membrane receptor protein involved in Fe transport